MASFSLLPELQQGNVNLVNAFFSALRKMRTRARGRAAFRDRLMLAVSKGQLSAKDLVELDQLKAECHLTNDDVHAIRIPAYLSAFQSTKRRGAITEQAERELADIQGYLGIRDAEVSNAKWEQYRARVFREIQAGRVSAVEVTGLALKPNEIAYWMEPGSIVEERVIDRRYEGGYQGYSIRIARGLSFHTGSTRGRLVTTSGIVPVSNGELVVTSQRVIFRGDKKGFNIRLDTLVDALLFSDGIRLAGGNGQPHHVHFAYSQDAEVIGALVSYAMNSPGRVAPDADA
jgi:hypothetical protein